MTERGLYWYKCFDKKAFGWQKLYGLLSLLITRSAVPDFLITEPSHQFTAGNHFFSPKTIDIAVEVNCAVD